MSELKNRNEILPEDKWSVEDLFSSDEAWQKLYDDIENSLSGFDKFKLLQWLTSMNALTSEMKYT